MPTPKSPTLHTIFDAEASGDHTYALSLSILIRTQGAPFLWCAGDDDVPLCTYGVHAPPWALHLSGWSHTHDALTYTPTINASANTNGETPNPHADIAEYAVTYRRQAFIGEAPAAVTYGGAIFNQPKDQAPWIFLHKTGADPFPFRFPELEAVSTGASSSEGLRQRLLDGPPFHFFVHDGGRYCSPPDMFENHGVQVTLPDLPAQAEALTQASHTTAPNSNAIRDAQSVLEPWTSEARAMDAYRKHGWGGAWVRGVLARAEAGRPLGSLERTLWCVNGQWGVELLLEPIPGSLKRTVEPEYGDSEEETENDTENEYEEEDSITMESYEVRARVQRVFVKPSFFPLLLSHTPGIGPIRASGTHRVDKRALDELGIVAFKRARLE